MPTERSASHNEQEISASYNNYGSLGNQITTQIIHGSVYNNTVAGVTQDVPEDASEFDDVLLASLAFPQMFDRRSTIENPHPSTCRWVLRLDEFKNWQHGSQGLLWIKGKPGVGKSTLMSFVYSILKENQHRQPGLYLDFFFNGRGSDLQKTPLGMFRCLLNQLFVQNEEVRPMIRKAFREKHASFGTRSLDWSWKQQELERLFYDAVTTLVEKVQAMIFIDALDEAGEHNAQNLARFFHKINDYSTSTSKNFKICISCRHYPFVSRVRATEIWVENHNKDDIALFIRDRLDIAALDRDGYWSKWQDLETNILERANGIFQWASLTVSRVEEGILHHETPDMVEAWLQDLPIELSQCYEQILRTQIDKSHRSQSSLLFALVIHAERPLSLSEVTVALATTESVRTQQWQMSDQLPSERFMRQRLKTLSGGLIEVSRNVQVIHQSVNDFLLAGGLDILFELEDQVSDRFVSSFMQPKQMPAESRCHILLHHNCLDHVNSIDPNLLSAFDVRRDELLRAFPWLSYSSFNLFVHAQHASEAKHKDMESYVDVLKLAFPKWMLTYWKLNSIYSSCPARGSTLTHMAASHYLSILARYLSKQKIDVNTQDHSGQSPLHITSKIGSITLAKIFLENGADPTLVTGENETLLRLAIIHGHDEYVAWLLQENICRGILSQSVPPVCLAAAYDNVKIAEILLAFCGASRTRNDDVGVVQDNAKAINRFLNDSVALSEECLDAIEWASSNGNRDMVRLLMMLLKRLGQVELMYEKIVYPAARRCHVDILNILLDSDGSSIPETVIEIGLCSAAREGHLAMIRILLTAGRRFVRIEQILMKAFEAAAAGGQHHVLKELAPMIEEATGRELVYENAMRVSVKGQYYGVVKLLLEINPSKYSAPVLEDAVATIKASREEYQDQQAFVSGTFAPRTNAKGARYNIFATDKYDSVLKLLIAYGGEQVRPRDVTPDPWKMRRRRKVKRARSSSSEDSSVS